MRLGITTKLYLAILATGVILIALVVTAQRMSLRHGFLSYVNRSEVTQLDAVTDALAAAHAQARGWDALRGNEKRWRRLVFDSTRRGRGVHRPPPEPGRDFRGPGEPRPQRGPEAHRTHPPGGSMRHLGPRLTLLDADREFVIGNPKLARDGAFRPIQQGEEIVGWLAVAPAQELRRPRDLRFVREQQRVAAWIAGLAIVLAAIVAVPLARHLLRPVHRLAQATRMLAAGDLSVRTVVDSGDELGQLGQDFNLLAHTLERNEQARRAFMADISHELRTPLAVLRGELEALSDGVRAVTPAALASLREEVRALGKLIDDLYDLARSDIGALEYRRADVDVAGLLGRAVDAYRERFDARRIAIECGIAPGPVVLRADPDRLQQLFANLLENTLRYTDPGGELRVLCAPRDGWLRIDLQDSAPGVPAESLDRLFERLYRVERSRGRAHGGAGLGLAICRNIVDAHGGRIAAKASPLGGLWIEILLPLPERGEPRDTPAV